MTYIIMNNKLTSWFYIQLTASLTKKNTFVGTPVSQSYPVGGKQLEHMILGIVSTDVIHDLITDFTISMIVLDGP